jgi:predicted chitinase
MPKGNSDAESPATETSTATGGASTAAASTSSGGGGSSVKRKGPFTKNQGRIVHTYQGVPAQNIQILINKMNAMGLTNTAAQVGILCVIGKESGFKPGKENSYANTSSERIKNVVFKTPMKNKTLTQIDVLKKDYNAFFNHVYGNQYGNTAPNDGSRYVGRGFNQITFKGNYASYSKKVGVDLVNNPDLLENPQIAADVAIKFLTRGEVKTFNTPEEAIIYYADINAGGKKSTFGREAAFKESNKFDIV